jgi:DNA mismatch repair ATPase MutS
LTRLTLDILSFVAKIGCHVPAEACKLTPVDRIFTRLGADDDICRYFVIILRVNGSRILNCSSVFRGLSTFLVEMKDIQVMLREATDDSLVSSENS